MPQRIWGSFQTSRHYRAELNSGTKLDVIMAVAHRLKTIWYSKSSLQCSRLISFAAGSLPPFRGREPAAKEIRRLHWRLQQIQLNSTRQLSWTRSVMLYASNTAWPGFKRRATAVSNSIQRLPNLRVSFSYLLSKYFFFAILGLVLQSF